MIDILFIQGRIHFSNMKQSPTFDSMLVSFGFPMISTVLTSDDISPTIKYIKLGLVTQA
jgi:hypothetical protein